MYQITQGFRSWLGAVLAAVPMLLVTDSAIAQSQPFPATPPATPLVVPQLGGYPACQPPNSGEFLLLVVSRTQDSQAQVQQLLPPNTSAIACTYLDDTVTRIGGFRTADRANAWARYITESTGLAAYVARPAEVSATPSAPPPPQVPQTAPSPAPTSTAPPPKATTTPSSRSSSAYAPKPLGAGYAVLVDYFNQPELAAQVQQALGTEVGLVSYGQRPYLLAIYTADSNAANAALQTLSDRGFWATLVDSRRVILLRQEVSLPKSSASK